MKEVMQCLFRQGYLIEQDAVNILCKEVLKKDKFHEILISFNPQKVITQKFILEKIPLILENFQTKLSEETKEYLLQLSSFYESKEKDILKKEQEETTQILEGKSQENNSACENLKKTITDDQEYEKEISKRFKDRKFQILVSSEIKNKKVSVDNFVQYFRARYNSLKIILQEKKLENLCSIGKISTQRKNLSMIGMVYNKRITKNKNLLLEIEDLTGKIIVLVNSNKKEVFEKAKEIVLDEVIAVSGTGSSEIFFANEIYFPESSINEKKYSPEEEYAAFSSDWHVGSKQFLEENALRFISWLNGEIGTEDQKRTSKKVKYLFIAGDLVDGIGIYPGQEQDLIIKDIYLQYKKFSEMIGLIRKDVTIIICPGNHDAVRLVEPQPPPEKEFLGDLCTFENVFLTTNPSLVNIGKTEIFPGFKVLLYHGGSYDYFMNDVDYLRLANAKLKPDMVMHFLLKRRHLAPTHTSTTYFPCDVDHLLIETVPDIFVSGHIHKPAISYYNNILTISCSAWMSKTPFQEKMGHEPDPCKVPLLNLKSGKVNMLDFS